MAWLNTDRLRLPPKAVGDLIAKLPMAGTLMAGLDWIYERALSGAPGLDGAEELALACRARHASAEEAIDALILSQTGKAGAAGFVTGLGGIATLPIAFPAHLVSALYIQIRLIAAIAHLRGYELHSQEVRLAVFACLSGSAAADKLKAAGVNFGSQFAQQMIAKMPAETVKNLNWLLSLHFAGRTGGHGAAHVAKLVPLVGGLIAGGFDAAATRVIGRTAKRLFAPRRQPGDEAPIAAAGPGVSPAAAESARWHLLQ